jgi:hypothetical protein
MLPEQIQNLLADALLWSTGVAAPPRLDQLVPVGPWERKSEEVVILPTAHPDTSRVSAIPPLRDDILLERNYAHSAHPRAATVSGRQGPPRADTHNRGGPFYSEPGPRGDLSLGRNIEARAYHEPINNAPPENRN